MIVTVPSLLTSAELDYLHQGLATVDFIDGQQTAGWHARAVKQNQQAAKTSHTDSLRAIIHDALRRNPLFQSVVRPKIIHSILLSRYDPGMAYGRHIDNALMAGDQYLRSDVSFTVFLNDPKAYDGGALVIEGADSETPYKLAAGSALVYPSTTLHRVDPVTHGQRLVAVGWVQSLVRDSDRREILFDLDTVKRTLFAQTGKTNEFDLVAKIMANLLRKWAE